MFGQMVPLRVNVIKIQGKRHDLGNDPEVILFQLLVVVIYSVLTQSSSKWYKLIAKYSYWGVLEIYMTFNLHLNIKTIELLYLQRDKLKSRSIK